MVGLSTTIRSIAFILGLVLASLSSAQISVTTNDMPDANEVYLMSTTFDQWSIDPALTGANYTWDYSYLTPAAQRSDTMHSVGSTPFLYQFFFNNILLYPNHYSDYASRTDDIDIGGFFTMENTFNYYANSSNSLRQTGMGTTIMGIPNSYQYNDIDTVYELPISYMDMSFSTWNYDMNIPTFGYYEQNGLRENEVDGWGEVTTPFGTFQCLRVKTTLNMVDSVYVDGFGFGFNIPRPETIEYKWLAESMGVPVLQITTSFGSITGIEYQDSARSVGITELSETRVSLYPNPATSTLNIEAGEPILTLEVYSLVGTLVMSRQNVEDELDVSDLARGTYILHIQLESGSVLEKLLITR